MEEKEEEPGFRAPGDREKEKEEKGEIMMVIW